ncbi:MULTISPECIES: hypothetical protein [Haloferax]|uniref:Uncharacterized protein n=2 Tax=Haloferax TaxID=2251 RepID=A0A6G1Z1F1_9EURY|nr:MULTISPECIES: hypothetical protein [Haloferax]KAB1187699.1 hypothetical protein Hfx1149_06490 [Haloferax sp. CBA1149]MRW80360.1 hypothetical protein [Haloferax marinisediminis]
MSNQNNSPVDGTDKTGVEHTGPELSRRSALRSLAGAGLLGLVGLPAMAGSVSASSSSFLHSGSCSRITGVGVGRNGTFTPVDAPAMVSPYHESGNPPWGSVFSADAQHVWYCPSGTCDLYQPADERIRLEQTFDLDMVPSTATLSVAADNTAEIYLNGTFVRTVGYYPPMVGQDVVPFLQTGENTLEIRAWNDPMYGDTPAAIIFEMKAPLPPQSCESTTIDVNIDIKPDSDDNSINPNSKGVTPVVVYSTDDFDATTLDVSSLAFGPGGASAAHGGHVDDVDGDGLMDLVLHFPTQDAGFADGDTEANLVGQTNDGTDVVGTDAIKTVGGKGKNRGRAR